MVAEVFGIPQIPPLPPKPTAEMMVGMVDGWKAYKEKHPTSGTSSSSLPEVDTSNPIGSVKDRIRVLQNLEEERKVTSVSPRSRTPPGRREDVALSAMEVEKKDTEPSVAGEEFHSPTPSPKFVTSLTSADFAPALARAEFFGIGSAPGGATPQEQSCTPRSNGSLSGWLAGDQTPNVTAAPISLQPIGPSNPVEPPCDGDVLVPGPSPPLPEVSRPPSGQPSPRSQKVIANL